MGAGSRTVGRVMSRTVIWLVVGGAIVIAAGLGVAWQVRMNEQAVLDRVTKPSAAVPQPAPSTADASTAEPDPDLDIEDDVIRELARSLRPASR